MYSQHFAMPIIVLTLLVAYGIGCLSAGFYLAKWRGVDLRSAGSGSTGARNAGRLLGSKAFALTFILDLAKGALAVLIARLWAPAPWAVPGALVLVVVGHVWPVQLRFQGGRGISPAVGGLLALSLPLTALTALPLLVGWAVARSFKRGGMLAVVVGPLLAWWLRTPLHLTWQDCAGFSLVALLLIGTHFKTLAAKVPNPALSPVEE